MKPTTKSFKQNVRVALTDAQLQRALAGLPTGLVANRAAARARLPEFDDLREIGRDIKDHTLAHLDLYLEEYERNATAAGAKVHWAATAAEAREIILNICQEVNAKIVTKGKSMITEEIGLNAELQAAGMEVVETDLGEYLVQIRGESPSHIIAPAIHLTQDQVEADFRRLHTNLPKDRVLDEAAQLVGEARQVLREKFLAADVGITGANFLIAETGSSVIVTNEGNGDLTQSLARVHVAVASIEKIVPTREDVSAILRLLARSATGQEISTYTTFSTGPRRADDPDGPEAYHVVILDNGRSELLGTAFREVLRCIRCGACMNHCPVYAAIGGHAYGWVYPGPIGAVLTPALIGVREAADLPNASTFCGRCEQVCPMKIPLPKLMRHHREAEFELGGPSRRFRLGLKAWAWLATRPGLYHVTMRLAAAFLGALGRRRGAFRWLPLTRGWTQHRDFPAPQGRTFQQLWAEHKAGAPR
ncbi:MAG TPA: LutB/LldF family L-lactate oxidation iron-sulfur protein [Hyphomicrobiaceae bacterium]|nr:LutB/LldF family L-lactate oxidation iron-sulfur protein [Hyphomicrobiaceae bacterium]